MAGQLIFFKKSRCDYELTNITMTASEAQQYVGNVRNRSNRSAWITPASLDANNTTIEIRFSDVRDVSELLLLKHNFKSYKVEYLASDGVTWTSLIDQTGYVQASSWHRFSTVNTEALKLTIRGTQVADSPKYLFQLIPTVMIGQLAGWPVFKDPTLGRDVSVTKMLSGTGHIIEQLGGYSTKLTVESLRSDADLTIIETLQNAVEGFLFWPCGGDDSQFSSRREGFRMEDIFLCRCSSRYQPEWYKGLYKAGIKFEMSLIQVNT